MKKLANICLVIGSCLLIFPFNSYAERVEAPVYKNGNWWRIKHEVSRAGFDVSG
jgi:hypothetical protein